MNAFGISRSFLRKCSSQVGLPCDQIPGPRGIFGIGNFYNYYKFFGEFSLADSIGILLENKCHFMIRRIQLGRSPPKWHAELREVRPDCARANDSRRSRRVFVRPKGHRRGHDRRSAEFTASPKPLRHRKVSPRSPRDLPNWWPHADVS